jgi:hypothetical protein
MNDNKHSAWMIGLLILLLAVSAVSVTMSYQALSLSRQVEQDRRQLQLLKAQVDRINGQLAEVSGKLGKMPVQMGRQPDFPPPPGPFPGQPFPPPDLKGLQKQGNGLVSGKIPKDAGPPPPPPPMELVNTEQVASHRKDLIERNASLHQADRDKYGDRLQTLYQAARNSPGLGSDSGDSDTALQQMLTDFPEANATGMVLGEKALESALKANTAAAEEYYRTMSSNENFASLVTDSGVEVMPALQGYLAYQYIQQGRIADAESIIQSLEGSYGSGLVAVPGPRGEPEWRPVADVVKGLRSQINLGQ